jgi:hypothetical protein
MHGGTYARNPTSVSDHRDLSSFFGGGNQVMRANQRRLAQSLANAPRTDTRDVKRGLAVVPFRHSKLTEVLMDYFVGDGKAVSFVR